MIETLIIAVLGGLVLLWLALPSILVRHDHRIDRPTTPPVPRDPLQGRS